MHSCRGQDDGDVRPMAHTRGDFRRSQRPISRSTRARHLYIYYRSRSHLHVVSCFPCSRRDVFLACLHNEADPGEYRMASATIGKFGGQLGLSDFDLADWIDMQFLAKRTRCITNLIYFPFVALAFLVLSRSPLFDDFVTPWTIVITQALSVFLV